MSGTNGESKVDENIRGFLRILVTHNLNTGGRYFVEGIECSEVERIVKNIMEGRQVWVIL